MKMDSSFCSDGATVDVNSYPLSRQLGLVLKEKGMRLVVVESCTV